MTTKGLQRQYGNGDARDEKWHGSSCVFVLSSSLPRLASGFPLFFLLSVCVGIYYESMCLRLPTPCCTASCLLPKGTTDGKERAEGRRVRDTAPNRLLQENRQQWYRGGNYSERCLSCTLCGHCTARNQCQQQKRRNT